MNKVNCLKIPQNVLNASLRWTDGQEINIEQTIIDLQKKEEHSSFIIDYNNLWKKIPESPAILIRHAWELQSPITTKDGNRQIITEEDLERLHVSDKDILQMKK